jgi:hypothetical protein
LTTYTHTNFEQIATAIGIGVKLVRNLSRVRIRGFMRMPRQPDRSDPVTEVLAKKIFEVAQSGVRDCRRTAETAACALAVRSLAR